MPENPRHPDILFGMAFQNPEGGAANDAVLGIFQGGFNRKRGRIPFKFDIFLQCTDGADGIHQNGAFTRDKRGFGSLVFAFQIHEAFVIHPGFEAGHVIDNHGMVDGQLGIEAIKSIGFGGQGQILNGHIVFNHDPGLPCDGHAVFGTGSHQSPFFVWVD